MRHIYSLSLRKPTQPPGEAASNRTARLSAAPKHATLLNTGKPVKFVVNLTPADHQEQKAYLRLLGLPANEMANTVLVVKLEFDRPLDELAQPTTSPDKVTDWQK